MRGDLVDLAAGGIRLLVLQADGMDALPTVTGVAATTDAPPADAGELAVSVSVGGQEWWLRCWQVHTVARSAVGAPVTTVDSHTVNKVADVVGVLLGLR